jgi:hypothetical protein
MIQIYPPSAAQDGISGDKNPIADTFPCLFSEKRLEGRSGRILTIRRTALQKIPDTPLMPVATYPRSDAVAALAKAKAAEEAVKAQLPYSQPAGHVLL